MPILFIGGSKGGAAGAPPPTGSNSFVFAYVFAKKCPCRRLVPPQWLGTPNGKSWIRHCYLKQISVHNGHSGGSRISCSGGHGPVRRHGPPMQVLFSENVCENERIGSRRGWRVSGTPPPKIHQWDNLSLDAKFELMVWYSFILFDFTLGKHCSLFLLKLINEFNLKHNISCLLILREETWNLMSFGKVK